MMFPFTTAQQTKNNTKNSDGDENVKSLEAMQGDEALISTVNELNDLRKNKDRLSETN